MPIRFSWPYAPSSELDALVNPLQLLAEVVQFELFKPVHAVMFAPVAIGF
jgi:hypothetical protein